MSGAPEEQARWILERARAGQVEAGSYAFGYQPKAGWVNLWVRVENAIFVWGLLCFLGLAGMLSVPVLEEALRGGLRAFGGEGTVPLLAVVILAGLLLLLPVIVTLWVWGPLAVIRHASENMLVVTPTHIYMGLAGETKTYVLTELRGVALLRAERWPHERPVFGGHLLMAVLGLGWLRQCAVVSVGVQMEKVQIGKNGEFGPAAPIVSAISAYSTPSALKVQSQSHVVW